MNNDKRFYGREPLATTELARRLLSGWRACALRLCARISNVHTWRLNIFWALLRVVAPGEQTHMAMNPKIHTMPIHVQTQWPKSRRSTKTPGQQCADHRPGTPNVKGAWQQLLRVSRAANIESTRHWITGTRIGRRIRGKERTADEQWSPTHEPGGTVIKAEGNASRGQTERERTKVRQTERERERQSGRRRE